MSTNAKQLTPWFVDGRAPARPGVYNVSCRRINQSGRWFARWDGRWWYAAHEEPKRAAWEPRTCGSVWHKQGSWRGIAKATPQGPADHGR